MGGYPSLRWTRPMDQLFPLHHHLGFGPATAHPTHILSSIRDYPLCALRAQAQPRLESSPCHDVKEQSEESSLPT